MMSDEMLDRLRETCLSSHWGFEMCIRDRGDDVLLNTAADRLGPVSYTHLLDGGRPVLRKAVPDAYRLWSDALPKLLG